jgi:uncharacterized protein
MSSYKRQRVRDPLHDLVEFRANEFEDALWQVVQSRPFQRLRRVRQLGFSELVYPGATHTRFIHSIGVFHTARELMNHISMELGSQYKETRANTALAASLVHDVGHGPFSHSFETVGKRLKLDNLKHEAISAKIIRDSELSEPLRILGGGFPGDVADLIAVDGPTDVYSSVVSSQFDADRLDYMRRDKLMTGTQHSEIDFTWLMANLRVAKVNQAVDEDLVGEVETLVLDEKAHFAAETYVLGLFQLYPTVYFHKATRSAEKIFTELLVRLFQLVGDSGVVKTGLGTNHPLIKFIKKPNDLDLFLDLDDTVIWGALTQLVSCKDQILSGLAKRLRDRDLWKSHDLRDLIKRTTKTEFDNDATDRIILRARDEISAWSDLKSKEIPRIVIDSANRPPYKVSEASSGPLNQIFIKDGSSLRDLRDTSEVVRAASVFKLDRAYFDNADTEAKQKISAAIKSAIQEEEK